MASQTFKLKLLTPQGPVLDVLVTSVVMPGIAGELTILPEHTQYTGVLGAGRLEYTTENSTSPSKLILSGGFASFNRDELVVLADSIDLPEQIASISVERERGELEAKLQQLNAFDPEWEPTVQKLKRLDAVQAIQ